MKFPHNTNFSQFWLLGEKSCGGEKLCKMPDPKSVVPKVQVITGKTVNGLLKKVNEIFWG